MTYAATSRIPNLPGTRREQGRDLCDWLPAKRKFEGGAPWPEQAMSKESATLADKEENHVFRLDRYK
jgi:hypothetical protein